MNVLRPYKIGGGATQVAALVTQEEVDAEPTEATEAVADGEAAAGMPVEATTATLATTADKCRRRKLSANASSRPS